MKSRLWQLKVNMFANHTADVGADDAALTRIEGITAMEQTSMFRTGNNGAIQ
ncbi:hypothetical protein OH492_09225 [Vibrio chagasii]|nr:hypothetical protein [Vibrio chagasii]